MRQSVDSGITPKEACQASPGCVKVLVSSLWATAAHSPSLVGDFPPGLIAETQGHRVYAENKLQTRTLLWILRLEDFPHPDGGALISEIMVPAAGVEPATFRSGGERSNPLSYAGNACLQER